jgi:hypothetical protein
VARARGSQSPSPRAGGIVDLVASEMMGFRPGRVRVSYWRPKSRRLLPPRDCTGGPGCPARAATHFVTIQIRVTIPIKRYY